MQSPERPGAASRLRQLRAIVQVFLWPWRAAFGDNGESLEWMELPDGIYPASRGSMGDLVPTVLGFEVDPLAGDVLSDCRDAPKDDNEEWHRATVWLRPEMQHPGAEVMVGGARVGWAALEYMHWKWMIEASDRSVYADGSLEIGQGGSRGPTIGALRCALPKE